VSGLTGLALPIALLVLGVAIIVRTLVAGGGALAFGLLMGILFVAAGAARLVLERRR
jgi:hypothetical protein